jgi:hypothetical protein
MASNYPQLNYGDALHNVQLSKNLHPHFAPMPHGEIKALIDEAHSNWKPHRRQGR